MQVLRGFTTLLVCLWALAPAQTVSGGVSIENLMDSGHWKRARQLVNARLRANPNDAFALYLDSKVAASFGDLEKGLDLAERAVRLEAHNPDYLAQLAEMHARLADRVSVLKQVNYVRKFRKEVETALSINPKHVDTMLVNVMFLSRAPMFAGGDKKRALALAQELAAIDGAWGNLVQARMAESVRDYGGVERSLTRAVQAKPSFYMAHYYLGKFYCCTSPNRKIDMAEKEARTALRLDPGQSGAYDILARIFVHQQRWTDLDAILAEGEGKVPDELSPYYQAASLLIEQNKDLARAERYLKKYLSQEPEGRQPTVAEGRQLLAVLGSKSGRGAGESAF